MPIAPSVQAEQKTAYLAQYSALDNPYVQGELYPTTREQQDNSFWITPLNGRFCCWSCGCAIQSTPYPCPVSYDAEKDIYRVQGMFCWFSCVLQYILNKGGHQESTQRQLLLMMMRDRYNWKKIVRPLNKLILDVYGGPISHADYLAKAAEGEPLPILRVREGYPFIPVDMFIEFRMKSIDFLRLDPPHLAPPSSIQQPFFNGTSNRVGSKPKANDTENKQLKQQIEKVSVSATPPATAIKKERKKDANVSFMTDDNNNNTVANATQSSNKKREKKQNKTAQARQAVVAPIEEQKKKEDVPMSISSSATPSEKPKPLSLAFSSLLNAVNKVASAGGEAPSKNKRAASRRSKSKNETAVSVQNHQLPALTMSRTTRSRSHTPKGNETTV